MTETPAPQAKRLSEDVLELIRLANDERRPSHAVADVYGLLEHIAALEAAAAAREEQVRELEAALAEAQAEVERLRATCKDCLQVQASPPACEGERVVNGTPEQENYERQVQWLCFALCIGHKADKCCCKAIRSAFPPPAANQRADEAAERIAVLTHELCEARKDARAWKEAFANAQTALVQTGEELREAKRLKQCEASENHATQTKLDEAKRLLRDWHRLFSETRCTDAYQKTQSFLTPKRSA